MRKRPKKLLDQVREVMRSKNWHGSQLRDK